MIRGLWNAISNVVTRALESPSTRAASIPNYLYHRQSMLLATIELGETYKTKSVEMRERRCNRCTTRLWPVNSGL